MMYNKLSRKHKKQMRKHSYIYLKEFLFKNVVINSFCEPKLLTPKRFFVKKFNVQ